MTLLIPTCEVRIQRLTGDETETDVNYEEESFATYADAFRIRLASGYEFTDRARNELERLSDPDDFAERQEEQALGLAGQATVEYAIVDGESDGVLTLQLPDLRWGQVQQMQAEGIVEVKAGYPGVNGANTQKVFQGLLESATSQYEAGRKTWTLTSKAFSPPFLFTFPKVRVAANEGATAGDIMERIANRAPITVAVPPFAKGETVPQEWLDASGNEVLTGNLLASYKRAITPEGWSTTGNIVTEFTRLIQIIKQGVKDTFGIDRNISIAPNPKYPLKYDIIDADAVTPEPGGEVDYLRINLKSSSTIFGEIRGIIKPVTRSPEAAEVEGGEAVADEAEGADADEIDVTTVFNPNIYLGLYVVAEDSDFRPIGEDGRPTAPTGRFPFIVTRVKHIMGGEGVKWRTEFGGKLQKEVASFVK